jgi:ribonuclease BN (tRNA processing enzyme)
VQVILVPSAISPGRRRRHYLTSFLINEAVAIDAGCLGFWGAAEEQARIKHLFLTHSHLDHVASLPMFLDNACSGDDDTVTVYGTAAAVDCLQRDLFNDRLWPDLIRLSKEQTPFLKLQVIVPGEAITVAGLTVTPVSVNHLVPTVGYLISDGRSSVAISSDTGPTEELWQRAGALADLKAVFLEATFPDELAWLADVSRHLTPRLFAVEARKIPATARIIVVHIHPRYQAQVVRELKELKLANVEIAQYGELYEL